MADGWITFRDTHDKMADVVVSGISDIADLQPIRETINNYSHAVPYTQGYSESVKPIGVDPTTGPLDSIEIKAVLQFWDELEVNPSKATKELRLGAPQDSLFEPRTDQGYRVIKAQGDLIAAAINNSIGTQWKFLRGYMEGSRLFKKV